jgi:hypothetical protein
MPDSQSLARLPCPIHDDDSGRRRSREQRYPVIAVFGAASVITVIGRSPK